MSEASDQAPTDLIGRDQELSEWERLLRTERLVTVSGPGGVGKTALVTELARRIRTGPWQTVARADLVRLDDPRLLTPRLAAALLGDGLPGRPHVGALADALGDTRALLVVDTCEHLADACTDVLTELVHSCPGLHVLAAGRTPMAGPASCPLRPLALDHAIRMFEASVRQWGVAEVPDTDDVQHICGFLDGLPLAVRIAAGQLTHHSPQEVLSLVSRAETLLDLTGPGLPARQRTLRDSLLRTHQLCTGDERLLWARCSVFPGAFGLSDAAEVCADERLPADALATAFHGLVRHALVQPQERGATTYRMPWSTRAHGRQWLDRLGEEREFLRRCLAWTLREA
ncbi:ATP-binding protein [Streptomyces olivaceiscleroticus]|uniref:Orc1-like AAA ATPase domain-containing protein n=1 Tax=Streptomyces olivaceiscleroticus TaxID=68245 RepID=A0ABP3L5R0_9ACTN